MEYFSAIKNKLLIHAPKALTFICIFLSGASHPKATSYMITFIWHSGKSKAIGTKN